VRPRIATPLDVAEVVRVTNAAYVVESFFITGTRTDEDEVRRHRATSVVVSRRR
jgi:hypothetical protein